MNILFGGYMKKKNLLMLLVLLIMVTGCQVVTPTPVDEVEQLKQQNQHLSDQLLETQRQVVELESQIETLNTQIAALQPEETPLPENPDYVAGLASQVLQVLMVKDFTALSTYVHPQFGVRFSPYGYVHLETDLRYPDADLLFTREEVANFASDETVYTWGIQAGSGFDIDMTVSDYWEAYVTQQDPPQPWEVLTDPSRKATNSLDNFAEVYPDAVYVEFYQPGTEEYSFFDWKSLRLGFQRSSDGGLYLIAIIHDEWTP